ncbi:hypothetical protein QQ045_006336 [Rhodiola kirilowii]
MGFSVKTLSFIFILICIASAPAQAQAAGFINSRKLLMPAGRLASISDSLLLNVLPKGGTPSSTPTKKGHAVVDSEKLFARHLGSVPSPGVGH